MLEQGAERYATSFDTLFGTPHGVDIASLCAATRTPHWRVESLPELEQALASPHGGVEVVEVRVRRDNRRALDARIRALPLDLSCIHTRTRTRPPASPAIPPLT